MDLYRNGDDESDIDRDTSAKVYAEREDIEAWMHNVWENEDPKTPETYDSLWFDGWDLKPDGPMDSISVLDCDRIAAGRRVWDMKIGGQ
ncbi:MAG: hypothetical protein Q9175_001733 [Cornicularia normoerica]